MGLCNDAGRRTGNTIDSPKAKTIQKNQGVCTYKKMGEFYTFMQIMQEKALLSGNIYTDGKDFARPPVISVAPSVCIDLWYKTSQELRMLSRLLSVY